MEAHPMNGGNNIKSYSENSSLQRRVGDSVKPLLEDAVAEKLDITTVTNTKTFSVVDLGCSIGPNTFYAMQNIVEAIKKKVVDKSLLPEFQVFFNDHTSNDFNTLFKSLNTNKTKTTYYAAGVPGSFYLRLFPKSSLHFAYTSWCIQWLSRVPEEVLDKHHVAWNKGKITYANANDRVVNAFFNQHSKDMDSFLQARAQELVTGGLMVIIIPSRPNGTPHSDFFILKTLGLLGSCLAEMVQKGMIDEEKLDSFNVPLYFPSPEELEESIYRNGCFSIERNESRPHEAAQQHGVGDGVMHTRAVFEGVIKEQFGNEILDELFEMLTLKFEENLVDIVSPKFGPIDLFVLLKRK